jgi:sugar fermentation stimulation protein A
LNAPYAISERDTWMRNTSNILFTVDVKPFRYVRRVNRFVAEIRSGERGYAFIRNTGRLLDLLVPTARCLCVPKAGGKTAYVLVGVLVNDGQAALVDPFLQCRAFETAASRGLFPWLRGWNIVDKEVTQENSRIDYMIGRGDETGFLETKSAAYFTGYYSTYPDCPTDRGLRHIKLLSRIATGGRRAVILFIAAHPSARAFAPNSKQDPRIAEALMEGETSGLEIYSMKVHLTEKGSVVIDDPSLPVVVKQKRAG